MKSMITRRTGCEGPKHDPYGYEEIIVQRQNGRKVMFHSGLGDWVKIWFFPGADPVHVYDRSSKVLDDTFEQWAGVSVKVAKRALEATPERRIRNHPCGSQHLEWVSGYPGERFLQCNKCHDIIDSSFNRKEIE